MKTAARDGSSLVVLAITAFLVLAAGLTLHAVLHPAALQPTNPDPTPLGYTWSRAFPFYSADLEF